MPKIAYIYKRFSSKAQASGGSLARQTERAESYAERQGFLVDRSLALEDLGVSGFTGENAEKGALAGFLKALKDGKIPKDSALIIESLDRLSRSAINKSLELFLGILNSGIEIHVISDPDNPKIYGGKADWGLGDVIEPIVELSRAFDESDKKSMRRKAGFERMFRAGKYLSGQCPPWLSYDQESKKYEAIEDKAETVRLIFRLAREGYGKRQIARKLNQDGVKPFGRAKLWRDSYIQKLTTQRQVLGEIIPHEIKDGRRVPRQSEPIKAYPAILDVGTYERTRKKISERQNFAGRTSNDSIRNLFQGLLVNGHTGNRFTLERRKTEMQV